MQPNNNNNDNNNRDLFITVKHSVYSFMFTHNQQQPARQDSTVIQ